MAVPNFDALRDLHNSANDLLHSPEIQQSLALKKQEKFVHQISEASLRMLDTCGISKDVILLAKQHLLALQLTLRRPTINDSKITAYEKLKKEVLKYLGSVKRTMKGKSGIYDVSSIGDDRLMVVVEVLREVRATTISIVESLYSLISIPWLDRKSNKTSLKSKLFRRSRGRRLYDFCDEAAIHSANKRLEAVEIAIEDLEVELECMFRRLIQTRVSLLNILTN